MWLFLKKIESLIYGKGTDKKKKLMNSSKGTQNLYYHI